MTDSTSVGEFFGAQFKKSTPNRSVDNWLNTNLGFETGLSNSQMGALGSGAAGLFRTWSDYYVKETDAKNKKAFQEYSNSMTDLSNAVNQDSITLNQIQYIDASTQQSGKIQTQGMTAAGSIQATAGAAGVRGNSVQVNLAHVEGTAAAAGYNREREFKYAMLGFDQARTTSTLTTAMNKKYSTFAGGSLLQSGLSSAMSVATMVGAIL